MLDGFCERTCTILSTSNAGAKFRKGGIGTPPLGAFPLQASLVAWALKQGEDHRICELIAATSAGHALCQY